MGGRVKKSSVEQNENASENGIVDFLDESCSPVPFLDHAVLDPGRQRAHAVLGPVLGEEAVAARLVLARGLLEARERLEAVEVAYRRKRLKLDVPEPTSFSALPSLIHGTYTHRLSGTFHPLLTLSALFPNPFVRHTRIVSLTLHPTTLTLPPNSLSTPSCTRCRMASASSSRIGSGRSAVPPMKPITLEVSLTRCQQSLSIRGMPFSSWVSGRCAVGRRSGLDGVGRSSAARQGRRPRWRLRGTSPGPVPPGPRRCLETFHGQRRP